MGQKVHPLGFRLNTTQKHKSIWFAQLNQYSALLEQDEIIRNYILDFINSNNFVLIKNLIRKIYN